MLSFPVQSYINFLSKIKYTTSFQAKLWVFYFTSTLKYLLIKCQPWHIAACMYNKYNCDAKARLCSSIWTFSAQVWSENSALHQSCLIDDPLHLDTYLMAVRRGAGRGHAFSGFLSMEHGSATVLLDSVNTVVFYWHCVTTRQPVLQEMAAAVQNKISIWKWIEKVSKVKRR